MSNPYYNGYYPSISEPAPYEGQKSPKPLQHQTLDAVPSSTHFISPISPQTIPPTSFNGLLKEIPGESRYQHQYPRTKAVESEWAGYQAVPVPRGAQGLYSPGQDAIQYGEGLSYQELRSSDLQSPPTTLGPPRLKIAGPPVSPYASSSSSSYHHHGQENYPYQNPSYPQVVDGATISLESDDLPPKAWAFDGFSGKKWYSELEKYAMQVSRNKSMAIQCMKAMRVHIMSDTIKACAMSHPFPHHHSGRLFFHLQKETSQETSRALTADELRELTLSPSVEPQCLIPQEKVHIMVVDGDSLDVGLICKSKNLRTCVLSMGNATERGGGFKTGAAAQEESLFRRTNLYYRQTDPSDVERIEAKILRGRPKNGLNPAPSEAYQPIQPATTIYTRNAIVFRRSEKEGYDYMSTPRTLDVLTACALRRKSPTQLGREEFNITQSTIRSILARAVYEKCDCIVLGALGCGAFNNPPYQIAQLFFSILITDGYAQFFRAVIFAIIDDHNSNGNLAAFTSVFSDHSAPHHSHPVDIHSFPDALSHHLESLIT